MSDTDTEVQSTAQTLVPTPNEDALPRRLAEASRHGANIGLTI